MRLFQRIILIIITLNTLSCVEDDIASRCESNCSTIGFRFFSNENEPLRGIRVNLSYRISNAGFVGGSLRRIIEVESDENGLINEEFFIQEDELGSSAEGFFSVDIDDSNLDVNRFITTDNQIGTTTTDLGFPIFSINQRDTIIERTYYFPRKTFITVNLNNFIPIDETDNFEVQTLYPFGLRIVNNSFLNTEFSTGSSGFGTFRADGQNTSLQVFVAANEQNVIRIFRRKNGISTSEDFPMFIPLDNDIELSFDF
jgi:hypothetical protein